VLPALGFGASISVQYQCGDTDPANNQMQRELQYHQPDHDEHQMSELKLRYWYTERRECPGILWRRLRVCGSTNVTGTFAAGYVEIGFYRRGQAA